MELISQKEQTEEILNLTLLWLMAGGPEEEKAMLMEMMAAVAAELTEEQKALERQDHQDRDMTEELLAAVTGLVEVAVLLRLAVMALEALLAVTEALE